MAGQGVTSTVPYDHLLKILLIGDVGSDKRRLLQTYMGEEEFSDTTTLGLDYKLKDVMYGSKRVKLQLWDTAGQERFRSVTASYYRGAHGALLVFTLTSDTSIANLNYWLDEISHNSPVKFQVILVATGLDGDNLEGRLDIAEQFAKERSLRLIKCVTTDPVSVESTFRAIIDTIMSSWEGSNVADSIRLDSMSADRTDDDRCC